jgi:hypothetical protein
MAASALDRNSVTNAIYTHKVEREALTRYVGTYPHKSVPTAVSIKTAVCRTHVLYDIQSLASS